MMVMTRDKDAKYKRLKIKFGEGVFVAFTLEYFSKGGDFDEALANFSIKGGW